MKTEQIPFNPSICLYDITIYGRGAEEDKQMLHNKHIYKNVRRGGTVLIVWEEYIPERHGISPSEEQLEVFEARKWFMKESAWARRGMFKFFDMCIEFVD